MDMRQSLSWAGRQIKCMTLYFALWVATGQYLLSSRRANCFTINESKEYETVLVKLTGTP